MDCNSIYLLIIAIIMGGINGESIECDTTLQGVFEYEWWQRFTNPPLTATFEFTNPQTQTVTFSTCDSEFFAGLKLFNSSGFEMQTQSTNQCSGCDCYSVYCTGSTSWYQTTFTMTDLPTGEYTVEITNECGSSDAYGLGSYNIFVICDDTGILQMFD